jgi:flagellar basal-body rod protein FlgF
MIKGIYLAGRSLESKFKNIEVIGNNLANVNTTGFKKAMPFSEIISGYNNVTIDQATNYAQGNLTATGNPLDLAINGSAFFAVQSPNGIEFTRNGKFSVSDSGNLVNEQGYNVMGKNGPININTALLQDNPRLSISKSGEIKSGDLVIDNLLIVKQDTAGKLIRQDGTNFNSGDNSFIQSSNDEFEIQQGYLEDSNVNPIEEMTAMIKIHNEYDSASKMVTFLDQSLGEANEIGKV